MATGSASASPAVFTPRFPVRSNTNCSVLPYLPPRLSTSAAFSTSLRKLSDAKRTSFIPTKATSEETSDIDTSELISELKAKWDAVEDKPTVIIYGGGAIVAIWLASIVVGAINSVPLLPKILELVGLGYTGWFVYRYLLFESSRKELASEIEKLKSKIAEN